jgi:hypothetical protein
MDHLLSKVAVIASRYLNGLKLDAVYPRLTP